MIKKLMLLGLLSTTANAEVIDIKIELCGNLSCLQFYEGVIPASISPYPVLHEILKPNKSYSEFSQILAKKSGETGILTEMLTDARQAAIDGGLESMKGELRFFKNEKLKFAYSFENDNWSIRKN